MARDQKNVNKNKIKIDVSCENLTKLILITMILMHKSAQQFGCIFFKL